jgi:hypothetical protein
MVRSLHTGLATALLLGLVACSGGSNGSMAPSTGSGGAMSPAAGASQPGAVATSETHRALAAVDAFGSRVSGIGNELLTELPLPLQRSAALRDRQKARNCNDGIAFYSPDRAGDANSNETLFFYNSHCTQLAVDTVRLITSTGANSETVESTISTYAPGHRNDALTTVTASTTYADAIFDANGFPVAADGFDRSSTAQLAVGTTPAASTGDEMVMLPSANNVGDFCSDFAGFNKTGVAALDMTFGAQGGDLTGGTRTVNPSGSVTWKSTAAGSIAAGAIGSLSIAQGTENTACPITTSAFALSGGTSLGNFSIPASLTFDNGILDDATITGATFQGGYTLDVRMNTHKHPENPNAVTGTVSKNGKAVAKFGTDAFGYGHVIVFGVGEFKLAGWTVVPKDKSH